MQRESSPPGGVFLHAVSVAICEPLASLSTSASGSNATGYATLILTATATQADGTVNWYQSWPSFAARQTARESGAGRGVSWRIVGPVAVWWSACWRRESHANPLAVEAITHVFVLPSQAWSP